MAALARLRARLGPGLIFAAAAVGTSHIVQSTRAGAGYGLTLLVLILVVCALKYPLFRFAADYAAITGESLVAGYGRHSRTLVLLMFATSAIEAVAATAGVGLVSASIMVWMLNLPISPMTAAVLLIVLTALVISVGRYRLLEPLTGFLVALFSLLTLIVTLVSLPKLLATSGPVAAAFPLTAENFSFAVAVSGWMPIGNTAAIMLAAWILARSRQAPRSLEAARFDFNLGYLASVVLAVCFLLLGAALLFDTTTAMPERSGPFVTTFVGLYTSTFGAWAAAPISIAALAVMVSTLIAIVDGFPRMVGEFVAELTSRDRSSVDALAARLYLPALIGIVLGASALLFLFFSAFATFIDLVTITGFLAAPIVALANQLVIQGSEVPEALRPGVGLLRWNRLAVLALSCATLGFLYLRFG